MQQLVIYESTFKRAHITNIIHGQVHSGLFHFAQFLNEPWGKLKILDLIYKPDATNPTKPGWGEGALNFFFR